jgi:hypothetical protein
MINKETTTFITHFINFFHLSDSHAAITLNHVTTVIIIAKKNAKALTADKTTKNTFQIRESVNHQIPQRVVVVRLSSLKLNTLPNTQLAA